MAPDDLAAVETELAIRRLNADFCYFLDHNDVPALVDLFTPDAEYSHGKRLSKGRAEIEALFAKRAATGARTSRHVQSGLRIVLQDDARASGTSACLTFAANETPPVDSAAPWLVADFVDKYRRCDDGRWRISRRHIERIFVNERNSGPVGTT